MNAAQLYQLAQTPPREDESPHQIATRIWCQIVADAPGLSRTQTAVRLSTYHRAAGILLQTYRIRITAETITDPTADDHRPHNLHPRR